MLRLLIKLHFVVLIILGSPGEGQQLPQANTGCRLGLETLVVRNGRSPPIIYGMHKCERSKKKTTKWLGPFLHQAGLSFKTQLNSDELFVV